MFMVPALSLQPMGGFKHPSVINVLLQAVMFCELRNRSFFHNTIIY
jgi:hypothetical protein